MALRSPHNWHSPERDLPSPSRHATSEFIPNVVDETNGQFAYESAAEITGGIAHDLNNLLDVISKLASLQIRAKDLSQTWQISHQIQATVQRAAKLTHRLFVVRTPVAECTELPGALADVVDMARVSAGENFIFRTISEPKTWAVTVDASDLQRAIMNLAINSVEAMPDGGTIVMTTLNTVLSDQRCAELHLHGREFVEIRVADTGRGMSAETLARAFEPHFTTKLDRTGTGLGLAQVQAFVRRSNGAIDVTTTTGVGTTISLYLPSASSAGTTVTRAPME